MSWIKYRTSFQCLKSWTGFEFLGQQKTNKQIAWLQINMLTCWGKMFQRRQFPLGPWWHRRTSACQVQAMESQFLTADAQLKEIRKPRNVKWYLFMSQKKIHPILATTLSLKASSLPKLIWWWWASIQKHFVYLWVYSYKCTCTKNIMMYYSHLPTVTPFWRVPS